MHGLSPGLSNAINSISRWSFIKASFPHIIHACAAALSFRIENGTVEKLTKTETKLLYTLHWLILDAASECEDNADMIGHKPDSKTKDSLTKKNQTKDQVIVKQNYLHSVATIQLFVYFFVPILKSLKPADFDNLKLNNGLKIWEALWAHRQPDIKIFNTPVKQKYHKPTSVNDNNNNKIVSKVSSPNDDGKDKKFQSPSRLSTKDDNIIKKVGKDIKNSFKIKLSSMNNDEKESSPVPPPLPKSSSYLDNLENKIKESDSSINESKQLFLQNESLNINNNNNNIEICSIQISDIDNDRIRDSTSVLNKSIYTRPNPEGRAPIVHMSSICSFTLEQQPTPVSDENDRIKSSLTYERSKSDLNSSFKNSRNFSDLVMPNLEPADKKLFKSSLAGVNTTNKTNIIYEKNELVDDFKTTNKYDSSTPVTTPILPKTEANLNTNLKIEDELNKSSANNIKDATFFDVAVMRCLLSPKWHTEGYLWALEYLSYRVTEITDFTLKEQDNFFKFKSPSLPCLINDLYVLMGIGSYDTSDFDDSETKLDSKSSKNNNGNLNNDFFDLINQINLENDFSYKNHSFNNYYDFTKRKKYEANFQTRIR